MWVLYYSMLLFEVLGVLSIDKTLGSEYRILCYILGVGFLLSSCGILYQLTKKTFFAYLAMVGFIFYIPIGIFGMIAVRNKMDEESKIHFLQEIENERN